MRIASYVLWSVSVLVIILVVVLYKTIKLGKHISLFSHWSHQMHCYLHC